VRLHSAVFVSAHQIPSWPPAAEVIDPLRRFIYHR